MGFAGKIYLSNRNKNYCTTSSKLFGPFRKILCEYIRQNFSFTDTKIAFWHFMNLKAHMETPQYIQVSKKLLPCRTFLGQLSVLYLLQYWHRWIQNPFIQQLFSGYFCNALQNTKNSWPEPCYYHLGKWRGQERWKEREGSFAKEGN